MTYQSLNNLEQEARHAILSCVSREISKLADDAFRAGQNSYFTEFNLINTIRANVENDKLSDAEFRQFVLNSLKTVE